MKDDAVLVLTLCCGARWTSCCSSSRLLLLFLLLLESTSVQSVLCAHVLHSHFNKALLVFPLSFRLSSPLPRNRFTFPLLYLCELKRALRVFLEPYLFSAGMLVCWLPAVGSPAAAASRHYPELSVELIGSLFFSLLHMQHQVPFLL